MPEETQSITQKRTHGSTPPKTGVGARTLGSRLKDFMEEPTQPRNNLNTILLSIVLGVVGFIGWQVWACSLQIASMQASVVPRAEIESKLAGVATEQARLAQGQTQLTLDIAELKFQMLSLKGITR